MTLKDKLEIGLKEDAPFRKDTFPKTRCAARKWSQVQDARAGFRHRAPTVTLWLTLPNRNQQSATIKPAINRGVDFTRDVDFIMRS